MTGTYVFDILKDVDIKEVRVITLRELRNDIYNKVGSVIATGQPIEIDYKEHIIRIASLDAPSKLANITKSDIILGDPEDLIYNGWASPPSKLARLKPHPEAIVGDPEDLMNVDWYEYGVLKQEYR